MTKITIRAGRQEWTGKTLKAARAAQQKQLDVLFADYPNPVLIPSPEPGRFFVVSRSDDGSWGYSIFRTVEPRDGVVQNMQECGGGFCPGDSRDDACDKARRHLAQNAYESPEHDGSEYLSPYDKKGREDHVSWVAFQAGYKAAKDAGADDNEAHRLGCEASSRKGAELAEARRVEVTS